MTDNNKKETPKPNPAPPRKKVGASPPPAIRVRNAPNPTKPPVGKPLVTPTGPTKPEGGKPTIAPAKTTGAARPQTTMTARASSRYEKDQLRQRQLVWATVGVVVFIVAVLGFGIWQTSLAPTFQTLARVGDVSINRTDYNKFRKIELFKQAGRIQQQLGFVQGDQATQLQSQLSLLEDEVLNVSSRSVNQATLEQYVNQLVLERAAKDKFNITVSDDEVNNSVKEEFTNSIYTPTANAAQAVQTQTAGPVASQGAQFATSTAQAITPLPTPTPSVSPTVTPTTATTPGAATTPGLTPGATVVGTPGAAGTVSTTVTVSATATVAPTATSTAIAADRVQQTAAANQNNFLKSFRTYTSLSDDDYKKLEGRPALIKKRVVEKLRETQPKVGDPYPAVKLSHILLKADDEAGARQIYDQLKATPADRLETTFVQLAREKSTDTQASAQNGDLGWSTDKTQFDKDFLAAALKLEKGQFTEPVKTQFGYHIIYATDKNPTRPLDALTIQGFEGRDELGDPVFFSNWLKDRAKEYSVSYNTPPTPAPTATVVPVPAFTPVIPPTATPLPSPTPVLTTTTAAAVVGTPGATTAATGTTAVATTVAATTAAPTTIAATTAASTTSVATTAVPTTTSAPAPTTAATTTVAPTPTP